MHHAQIMLPIATGAGGAAAAAAAAGGAAAAAAAAGQRGERSFSQKRLAGPLHASICRACNINVDC